MAKENNWFFENYTPEDIRFHGLVMNATESSNSDLRKYLDKAFFKFYFRPKYIFRRLNKLSLQEIQGDLIGLKLLIMRFLTSKIRKKI